MPLCEGEQYKVVLAFMTGPLAQGEGRTYNSIWDYFTQVSKESNPTYFVGENLVYMADSQIQGSLRSFLNRYMPTSMELRCAKTFKTDGLCVDDIYFKEAIKDKNIQVMFPEYSFTLKEDNKNGIFMTDPTTGASLCYAKYYINYNFDANYLIGPGPEQWYTITENETMNAKVTEPAKWLHTFYKLFNPFDLSLPGDRSLKTIVQDVLNNGILSGLYMILLVGGYYVSKAIIWVLLYGLISYLWMRAAGRSSIYLLLLVIFILLLLLGKFGSYTDFINMLSGR